MRQATWNVVLLSVAILLPTNLVGETPPNYKSFKREQRVVGCGRLRLPATRCENQSQRPEVTRVETTHHCVAAASHSTLFAFAKDGFDPVRRARAAATKAAKSG